MTKVMMTICPAFFVLIGACKPQPSTVGLKGVVCTNDAQCAAGETCSEGNCTPPLPKISRVEGNGAEGTIFSGLKITGENLAGVTAARLLTTSFSALGDFVVGTANASQLEVTIPATLATAIVAGNGQFVLELQTNRGVVRDAVSILKGDAGPMGSAGPAGATGARGPTGADGVGIQGLQGPTGSAAAYKFARQTTNVTLAANATTSAGSITVTAPTAGHMLIIALGSCYVANAGAVANLGIETDPSALSDWGNPASGSLTLTAVQSHTSFATQRSFPVTAGSHTFHFAVQNDATPAFLYCYPIMTAHFSPALLP